MIFSKPYLASATFLLEFAAPVQSIRFEQGRAEAAFGAIAGTQSQQTNVPDSMEPNVARIVFQGARKSIAISQSGLQIDFHFQAGGVREQIAIVEKNASAFYAAATEKFAITKFGLSALILGMQFPTTESTEQLQRFLRSCFIKDSDVEMEPASTQVALGFKKGDYFVNIAAEAYERREVKMENLRPGETRFINAADGELKEHGMGFKVDVNNKPAVLAARSTDGKDFAPLMGVLREFLDAQFPKLTGLTL